MRDLVLALTLALAIVGCAAPSPSPSPEGSRPARVSTLAIEGCTCWEPAIASDATGALFVVLASEPTLVASDDGGASWEARVHPSLPSGAAPLSSRVDGYVQASPDGTLFYVAFLSPELPIAGAPTGLQVARSKDGARSWETNVVLSLPTTPAQGVVSPWKSWIGFGPDDKVHIVYNQRGGLVVYGRSDDGGASWGEFRAINVPGDRAISSFPAQPVVDEDGRLFVAYFGDQTPNDPGENPFFFKGHALKVALSDDGGASFRTMTVASKDPPGYVGTWFPTLVASAGAAHLAYLDDAGTLRVVSSADRGETWGAPVAWSEGDAMGAAPWALAADGRLAVLHGTFGGEYAIATAPLSAAQAGPTASALVVADFAGIGDFAHFAALPDGRVAVPWLDGESGMRVDVFDLDAP